MKKKTVVHVAQSAGGVAEYLYMLLKNFDSKDYENILIVSEDYKEQLERFKIYIKDIYFVPMMRNINPKSDIKAIFKLNKILKDLKPDIVYLHSSKAGAIGRLALLFNFRTKILYNAHGWYFNAEISSKKKFIFAVIEKILAIKTHKIINISKSEQESALKYKIASKNKMTVIENGIDFSKFDNCDLYKETTRAKYNIQENDIVIGVVGRLSEQKDPITSIKAFNIIKHKYPNTKFMFIGSGELENDVLEYAKKNGIEKDVIITGWVNNVEKYIPALDIAILPSKWEGFGLVIIEYMACNKPIVAARVGGISDIIKENKNGYLIEINDYLGLAKKIESLINNKRIKESMIEANCVYREKYDIKNLEKDYKELFDNICEK